MRTLLDLVQREALAGDDHRAVALAHAAAARHQRVVVLQVGVGVEGDRRDVVEGLVDGLLVQRLDVGEGVGELQAGHAHLVGGEAVKHECVIGVRRVRDLDLANTGLGVFQLRGACSRCLESFPMRRPRKPGECSQCYSGLRGAFGTRPGEGGEDLRAGRGRNHFGGVAGQEGNNGLAQQRGKAGVRQHAQPQRPMASRMISPAAAPASAERNFRLPSR